MCDARPKMGHTIPMRKTTCTIRALLLRAAVLAAVLPALFQLFAHRQPPFHPSWAREDLSFLYGGQALAVEDYSLLFRQTGLGRAGVDQLLSEGEAGIARILEIQDDFFSPAQIACSSLNWPVREELRDSAAPSVPLLPGDVLLTFSTHTLGWRHGHAGLAVDAGNTAEAVCIGSASALVGAEHWNRYGTCIHLRLRNAPEEAREQIARFALETLDGLPYRLTCGLLGQKDGGGGAQCAWLVWRALWEAGYDDDADGGRLVTVADLAASPLFEVVQIRGIDPESFPSGPF